jgi:hypothetical protein
MTPTRHKKKSGKLFYRALLCEQMKVIHLTLQQVPPYFWAAKESAKNGPNNYSTGH